MDKILHVDGFEWDAGNISKSFIKHGIIFWEAEEVFKNEPLLFFMDEKHSTQEKRFIAFGRTNQHKLLIVAFTLRIKRGQTLIRVISARPMHQKERVLYEKAASKT